MLLKLLNAAFFHHTPAERTLNTENMHYSLVRVSIQKAKIMDFLQAFQTLLLPTIPIIIFAKQLK